MVCGFSLPRRDKAGSCTSHLTSTLTPPTEVLFLFFLQCRCHHRHLPHCVCYRFYNSFRRPSCRWTPSLLAAWRGWGQRSAPPTDLPGWDQAKRGNLPPVLRGTLAPTHPRTCSGTGPTTKNTSYRSVVDGWGYESIP